MTNIQRRKTGQYIGNNGWRTFTRFGHESLYGQVAGLLQVPGVQRITVTQDDGTFAYRWLP